MLGVGLQCIIISFMRGVHVCAFLFVHVYYPYLNEHICSLNHIIA